MGNIHNEARANEVTDVERLRPPASTANALPVKIRGNYPSFSDRLVQRTANASLVIPLPDHIKYIQLSLESKRGEFTISLGTDHIELHICPYDFSDTGKMHEKDFREPKFNHTVHRLLMEYRIAHDWGLFDENRQAYLQKMYFSEELNAIWKACVNGALERAGS